MHSTQLAYYRHHPLAKQAAFSAKPLLTTVKNVVGRAHIPHIAGGMALGGALGTWLGNKQFHNGLAEGEGQAHTEYLFPDTPPVKALPEYEDRAFIQPINQKQVR